MSQRLPQFSSADAVKWRNHWQSSWQQKQSKDQKQDSVIFPQVNWPAGHSVFNPVVWDLRAAALILWRHQWDNSAVNTPENLQLQETSPMRVPLEEQAKPAGPVSVASVTRVWRPFSIANWSNQMFVGVKWDGFRMRNWWQYVLHTFRQQFVVCVSIYPILSSAGTLSPVQLWDCTGSPRDHDYTMSSYVICRELNGLLKFIQKNKQNRHDLMPIPSDTNNPTVLLYPSQIMNFTKGLQSIMIFSLTIIIIIPYNWLMHLWLLINVHSNSDCSMICVWGWKLRYEGEVQQLHLLVVRVLSLSQSIRLKWNLSPYFPFWLYKNTMVPKNENP